MHGIERQCPDLAWKETDGLNILPGTSLDSLTLVLLAAACVAFVLLVVTLVRGRARRPEPVDPGEALRHDLAAVRGRVEALERGLAQIASALPAAVQGVGVVRYNPFTEMGGSMSFSVAFLDGQANGVVISVLNDRQGSRVYGKPVEAGTAAQKLSDEEQQAIDQARARRPAPSRGA